MKYIRYITGLTLIAALAACSSDDDIANPTTGSNLISFQTKLDTRATRIDALSQLDSLVLSGWQYATAADFATTAPVSFFYNNHVGIDADGKLTTSYSWPNNGNLMSFFMYGPISLVRTTTNTTGQLTPTTLVGDEGPQKFTFTVPNDTTRQHDLIVGTVSDISANQHSDIPITLQHALTGVQFVVGADSKAVTWNSIQITNIYSQGTYTMGSGWTARSAQIAYTLTPNVTTGEEGYAFAGNGSPFLLLPQTLTTDETQSARTTIIVRYTDTDGTQFTRTYTPSATTATWEPGKIVTYQLSVTSRYELAVKSVVSDWTQGDTKETSAETPIQE